MIYPDPSPGLEWVALDFDGILARQVWPDPGIGALIPEGKQLADHYHDRGYKLVVHTSRPWDHHGRIWDWLRDNDIPVALVVCGKILAGLYVDDRSHRPEWVK